MMGNVLDIFRSDAFSLASMIARFDGAQFVPSQATRLGLFSEDSISTLTAFFEVRDQILTLIQTSERGASGEQVADEKRQMHAIRVPHLQRNRRIVADEVAGVREFGTTNALQTVESLVNRKLQIIAADFDGTLEHLLMGALQGIVKDANGATITNLYTLFGVSKEATKTFPISASNAAGPTGDGSLNVACRFIERKIWDNLRLGAVKPTTYCLASPGFWDAFTTSNEVRTNFQRFRDNGSLGEVGAFLREGAGWEEPPFQYGGILFKEYRGGNVPTDEAMFFPMLPAGLPPLYPLVYAPADYVETVNTLGLPRYAKIAIDPVHQKWVDIEAQSNPLPICLRPTALMAGNFS